MTDPISAPTSTTEVASTSQAATSLQSPSSWSTRKQLGAYLTSYPHHLMLGRYSTLWLMSELYYDNELTDAQTVHEMKRELVTIHIDTIEHTNGTDDGNYEYSMGAADALRRQAHDIVTGRIVVKVGQVTFDGIYDEETGELHIGLIRNATTDGRLSARIWHRVNAIYNTHTWRVEWKNASSTKRSCIPGASGERLVMSTQKKESAAAVSGWESESAEFRYEMDQVEPWTFPSPSISKHDDRCYLTEQPIVILASMCRFLTSRELASVDCTNRLMSQAASHPIVYRTSEEIGIESSFNGCFSYLIDCPVIFTFHDDLSLLRTASSRRLHSVRSIRLSNFDNSLSSYSGWYDLLSGSAILSLRSLEIDRTQNQSSFPSNFAGSLRHLSSLRLFHLTDTDHRLREVVPLLPPSLDLLHLTSSDTLALTLIGLNIYHMETHPDRSNTTKLILELKRSSNSIQDSIWQSSTTVHHLQMVYEIEQIERITEFHYRELITLKHHMNDLMKLMRSKKVERFFRQSALQLDVHDVNSHILATFLSQFPHLIRLDLYPQSRMIDYARLSTDIISSVPYTFASWPVCVQRTLRELLIRVTSLSDVALVASAGIEKLDTLVVVPSAPDGTFNQRKPLTGANAHNSFMRLFQANPHLTHVDLLLIDLSLFDVLAFQHLSSLRKLQIRWPNRGEHTPLPADGLASVFPSLTQLYVSESTSDTLVVPTQLFLSIPLLSRFKWRHDSWVTSREAIESIFTRIDQFEKEKCDAAARRVPPRQVVPTSQTSSLVVRSTRVADIARVISIANKKLKSGTLIQSTTVPTSASVSATVSASIPAVPASFSWSSSFAPDSATDISKVAPTFSFTTPAPALASTSVSSASSATTTNPVPFQFTNPFDLNGSNPTESNGTRSNHKSSVTDVTVSSSVSTATSTSSSSIVDSSSSSSSSSNESDQLSNCYFVSATSIAMDELRLLLNQIDQSDRPQFLTNESVTLYLSDFGTCLDLSLVVMSSSMNSDSPQSIALSLVAEEMEDKLSTVTSNSYIINTNRTAFISDIGVVTEYRTQRLELLLLQTQLDLLRSVKKFDYFTMELSSPGRQTLITQSGRRKHDSQASQMCVDLSGSLAPIDHSLAPLTGCTVISLLPRHVTTVMNRRFIAQYPWSRRLSHVRMRLSQPGVFFLGMRRDANVVISSEIDQTSKSHMTQDQLSSEIEAYIILEGDADDVKLIHLYAPDPWWCTRLVYFLRSRFPPSTVFTVSLSCDSPLAAELIRLGFRESNWRREATFSLRLVRGQLDDSPRCRDTPSPSFDPPEHHLVNDEPKFSFSVPGAATPFKLSSSFLTSSSSESSTSSSSLTSSVSTFSSSFGSFFTDATTSAAAPSSSTVAGAAFDFSPMISTVAHPPPSTDSAAASLHHSLPPAVAFSTASTLAPPSTFSSSSSSFSSSSFSTSFFSLATSASSFSSSSSSVPSSAFAFSSFGPSSFVFEPASASSISASAAVPAISPTSAVPMNPTPLPVVVATAVAASSPPTSVASSASDAIDEEELQNAFHAFAASFQTPGANTVLTKSLQPHRPHTDRLHSHERPI